MRTRAEQPLILKDDELFLVTDRAGEIAKEDREGLGLFFRDTRYLSGYELRVGGAQLTSLIGETATGRSALVELSAEQMEVGGEHLPRQPIGVKMRRMLDGKALCVRERLVLRSYAKQPVSIQLTVTINALFEDVFQLRGFKPKRKGSLQRTVFDSNEVRFGYHGADKIERQLRIRFSNEPMFEKLGCDGARASFDLLLPPQKGCEIGIDFYVSELGRKQSPAIQLLRHGRVRRLRNPFSSVSIVTDDDRLNRVLAASIRDLGMLITRIDRRTIAGGLPWYVSLFGRDSLVAAWQILPFAPDLAADVARQLAVRQGSKRETETGEEPGKIPHELRLGEMANLGEIDARPSYRSIDSTPLFVILLAEHLRWTGAASLGRELHGPFRAALEWIYAELEAGGGYLSYKGTAANGLRNQGWKDSSESIVRQDGSLPRPPIALCEVQGRAFMALRGSAALLRALGDEKAASAASGAARSLRARFNRDFWIDRKRCFALALEKGRRKVETTSSNTGQLLCTGIADEGKARKTCRRLTRPDMWTGWGIRTISELSPAYNPVHYHLGSVWPFDNALIVAGMRRCGRSDLAVRLFADVTEAIASFELERAPEFYPGFRREAGCPPARHPLAQPLQAWSASAVPFMLLRLLGLEAAEEPHIHALLDDPVLPASVTHVLIKGLEIRGHSTTIELERDASGQPALVAGAGVEIRTGRRSC